MKGLLIKDFYCAVQFLKTYLLMMVFFSVMGFVMKNPAYLVMMGVFMGLNVMLGSLSMDEMGGFSYCLIMPFSRRQIVKEKYLFLIAETVVVFLFSMFLGLILCAVTRESVIICVWSGLFVNVYYIALMSVLFPIAFKWKLERARMAMLGLIMIPVIGVLIINRLKVGEWLAQMNIRILESPAIIFVFSFVLAAVMLLISYRISLRIFEKKEF